jgi:GST-like protein
MVGEECTMAAYQLFGRPGWGSVIVEAQLTWLDLPFEYRPVGDLLGSAEARSGLEPLNPLAQVPTLVLPDGSVMTESAAITLHLADASGRDDLVPAAGHPTRPPFLRWLVFLVANVYPTFTYADDPSRFVADDAAASAFAKAVKAYRRRLWTIVEGSAGSPWFLGGRFSALDVYVAAMTHWGPGRKWFDDNAPVLAALGCRALDEPRLRTTWQHNFPDDFAA